MESPTEGATTKLTIAQRIYNAVVAQNPILLIVAAVALLVAGTYALVKEYNEENKENNIRLEAYKNIYIAQQEALDLTKEQTLEINTYQKIINDVKSSELDRLLAIDNLNEKLGTHLKLSDDINNTIERYNDMIKDKNALETTTKLITNGNNELTKKNNELMTESVGLWEGIYAHIKNFGNMSEATMDIFNTRMKESAKNTEEWTKQSGILLEKQKELKKEADMSSFLVELDKNNYSIKKENVKLQIDLMKEGLDKTLKDIQFNYSQLKIR